MMTSTMVVSCVQILKFELDALYTKYSSKFVLALKECVHKRLSHYEEHDAFQTASFLDLCFKLNWCTESESLILKRLDRWLLFQNQTQQPAPKKHHGFFSA